MTDSTTHPVKKDAKGSSLPAQRGGGKGRPPIAPKPARQLAVEALHRVNAGGGYSNLVLDSALSAQRDLSAREKGFAAALFYGVLERQITLDRYIDRLSRIPPSKVSPLVREILRVSLYQLLYMEDIPSSAAVNEGVELTRRMGQKYAAGFVNGLLRSFLRGDRRLPSLPGESLAQQLSAEYSCPQWLVEEWLDSYGEESTASILSASLGQPPLYARVNTLRWTLPQVLEQLEKDGVSAHPAEGVEDGIRFQSGGIEQLEAYRAGAFHLQDLSSQLCARLADARPGMRVLDLCAAPGGKAFTMAQFMEDQGELIACDLHEKRVGLIRQGAERLGIRCIRPLANDAAKLREEWMGGFDRVLCDVPCSGLGIIRRKPEIKYKPPEELEKLPEIQYKILETSANYVKEGGLLTYSTCTLRRLENDQVVDRFLREHREFVPSPLPGGLDPQASGRITLFPSRMDSDGFFVARLQRRETTP